MKRYLKLFWVWWTAFMALAAICAAVSYGIYWLQRTEERVLAGVIAIAIFAAIWAAMFAVLGSQDGE